MFFVLRAEKGPTPQRANSAVPATCRSDADGQADHWKLASKALQNLDAKLKEIIVVEVDWIGTTMPSPRNPDGRPLSGTGVSRSSAFSASRQPS